MERNVVIILSVIVLLAFGMLFIAATQLSAPPVPEPSVENQGTPSTTEETTALEVTGPTSTFQIAP